MDVRIRFPNEEGIDAGGLTNEWLTMLTKEVFSPEYGLFTLANNGRSIQPSPFAHLVPDYLIHFRFLGRLVAKFLLEPKW
mmetsp:Transcript_3939/g.607  ORF Transcript_3939/g.607 Transcript_3939/m.607 type:complete len:80 (+) Transcript_3939:19-258(+)